MREIKLQGWVEEYRLMGRIHAINFDENEIQIEFDVDEKPFYTGEFKDVKIRQYTGLKDKNGKEIYEGDIVRKDNSMGDTVGTIIFDSDIAGFALERPKKYYEQTSSVFSLSKKENYDDGRVCFDCENGFEIIGNIYENPELI